MIGADPYIQKQKVELLINLRDDVVWRNDALVRAWNQLDVDSAQDGLTAPDAGGTQLRLKSVAHAQIYTQQIAAVLESLLGSLPDAPPAVEYRSEEDVALQVVNDGNQIQMIGYPETVNQDNFIADAVLKIRVDELFDAKNHGVEAKTASLKQALIIFLASVLVCCACLIMMRAWKDLVRPC
jgi:hypothetical protein